LIGDYLKTNEHIFKALGTLERAVKDMDYRMDRDQKDIKDSLLSIEKKLNESTLKMHDHSSRITNLEKFKDAFALKKILTLIALLSAIGGAASAFLFK